MYLLFSLVTFHILILIFTKRITEERDESLTINNNSIK